MNVYYNETTNEIYIDKGSQTTTVSLPRDIKPMEVDNVLHGDALKVIIDQLID